MSMPPSVSDLQRLRDKEDAIDAVAVDDDDEGDMGTNASDAGALDVHASDASAVRMGIMLLIQPLVLS